VRKLMITLIPISFIFSLFFLLMSQDLLPEESHSYDVLFINGKVMNGTGNPWFYGDVGIKDVKIAKIALHIPRDASARVIDIKGKVIAPGFIDIHTHAYDSISDETVWRGEDEKRYFAPNFVSQGVTTLVSNQCGSSPLSIKKQMQVLASKGTGPNILLLIGHNSIRKEVMENDYRRPATAEEIEKMKKLVKQAMEDGAAGLSTGLEYTPCIWSTKEELVALVEEIVPYAGVFMAHERASGLTPMWYVPSLHQGAPPTMLENVEELIEIAEQTRARVVITHIKARGANFWGASRVIINMIERARQRGLEIWADCYPYNTSGSDGEVVIIPEWAIGKKEFSENLRKVLKIEQKLKNLERDVKHAITWRGGAENIIVMDSPHKSYLGKSLAQLAQENGISSFEMAIRLQLEGDPERAGGARLRSFSLCEMDIEAFTSMPWTATCSDAGITLPADGPSVHPRFYGTFPRKIRHYALEKKIISVEDAVRASTSLPAQILGLEKRGKLEEGYHADVVVFDPERIGDRATFFEPHQYAEGIDYVMVNGVFVVENGELTWKKAGKVISLSKSKEP